VKVANTNTYFQGKVSAPRSLVGKKSFGEHSFASLIPSIHVAGLGAGMTEAIFAVTPSETIKCDLCHWIDTCNSKFRAQDKADRRRKAAST